LIFSAEANAILLALKFIASSDKSKFMICSDSLSCLLVIESCKTQNPFIIPPLPEGGGGYTVLPLSVCPSIRPRYFSSHFSQ
jgi:hypothetical protein